MVHVFRLLLLGAVLWFGSPRKAMGVISQGCKTAKAVGLWKNSKATGGVTRIGIRAECSGVSGPRVGDPRYFVHIYAQCAPQDCDWGERLASFKGAEQITATYDQRFAVRQVVLKLSPTNPSELRGSITVDFLDPNRKDYIETLVLERIK